MITHITKHTKKCVYRTQLQQSLSLDIDAALQYVLYGCLLRDYG